MSAYKTVKIEREDGITFVVLNRPEKRNAMNPTMHYEMLEVWDELEFDPETKIVVLTGAGDSWCAGQDLKESFLETAEQPARAPAIELGGLGVALAAAVLLPQAHHRHGQRLLLRRRLHPADRLRLRVRGRRGHLRPERGQLGLVPRRAS